VAKLTLDSQSNRMACNDGENAYFYFVMLHPTRTDVTAVNGV
jgi:hypothetical protein